jgi:hypothetical protein
MVDFKRFFSAALRQVLARYQAARIEADSHGLRLFNSPPPVKKQLVLLPPPSRT